MHGYARAPQLSRGVSQPFQRGNSVALQRSHTGSTGSVIGIILILALLPATQCPSQAEEVAGRSAVMIPEPRIVLRDSVVTPPSSTTTLDRSGRSGTFSVSGGDGDNLVLD